MKQPHGDPHFRFIHSFVLFVLLPCILVLGDLRAVVFWEKHWSLRLIFGFVSFNYLLGFLFLDFFKISRRIGSLTKGLIALPCIVQGANQVFRNDIHILLCASFRYCNTSTSPITQVLHNECLSENSNLFFWELKSGAHVFFSAQLLFCSRFSLCWLQLLLYCCCMRFGSRFRLYKMCIVLALSFFEAHGLFLCAQHVQCQLLFSAPEMAATTFSLLACPRARVICVV